MLKMLITIVVFLVSGVSLAGVLQDILEAAERADTPKVLDLLHRGMDVNTADADGNTLLMIAARTQNMELASFLLKNRAGVNRKNRYGDTAILMAALRGDLGGVKLLHSHGAELDTPGWGVLHYATFAETPEVLLWATVQRTALDRRAPNGMTALMLATKQGKLSMVRALVEKGAKTAERDADGQTAAGLARKLGFDEIAAYLDQAQK